jgi:hypothetical protein
MCPFQFLIIVLINGFVIVMDQKRKTISFHILDGFWSFLDSKQ